MSFAFGWIGLGVAIVVVGAGLTLQGRSVAGLRVEAEALRLQSQERQRLLAQNEHLKSAQSTEEQLARIAAARDELARLDREIPMLRGKVDALARPAVDAMKSGPEPARASDSWHNVGRGTPKSVTETALWAALHGEVDLLAGLLVLEPEARRSAEELLASLPEASRVGVQTPEKLIALIGAKDVVPGEIQMLAVTPRNDAEVSVRIRLPNDRPGSRIANLNLRSTDEGWALVVPERAVRRYAEQLRAPASP